MYVEVCALRGLRLQVPVEKGTFQETATALFNNLPDSLKRCDYFNLFSSQIFGYRPAYLNCTLRFIHMIIVNTFSFNHYSFYYFCSNFYCKYSIHIF